MVIRQFEAFYAGGELGDRFIVAKCVQLEDTFLVVHFHAGEPSEATHGANAELTVQELCPPHGLLVLVQAKTPTFAVVFGVFPGFRKPVKKRVALGTNGCSLRVTSATMPSATGFYVWKFGEVGELLQSPRPLVTAVHYESSRDGGIDLRFLGVVWIVIECLCEDL